MARWASSTHDRAIFHESRLTARFETREIANGYFLGDGGYHIFLPLFEIQSRSQNNDTTGHKECCGETIRCNVLFWIDIPGKQLKSTDNSFQQFSFSLKTFHQFSSILNLCLSTRSRRIEFSYALKFGTLPRFTCFASISTDNKMTNAKIFVSNLSNNTSKKSLQYIHCLLDNSTNRPKDE